VETRVLKQTVKRNIARFPIDFMFELSKNEWQEVITNCDNLLPLTIKFSPVPPFAFTEQGVSMLSGVLKSTQAIETNIQIIRIFGNMRRILMDNAEVQLEIERIKRTLSNYDKSIELIFANLDELLRYKEKRILAGRKIGFKIRGKNKAE
ncbi:MAG: ORF6N domain-containing protein, partial [Pedobacter sp.]